MSDETPVERRLRDLVEFGPFEEDGMTREHYAAIDCGREAIRLLREYATINHVDDGAAFDVAALALLARCTEGPR